ncbi:hypothetical protein UlMin_026449 [Ulmus minor]
MRISCEKSKIGRIRKRDCKDLSSGMSSLCYVYVAIYILPLLHKGNTARTAPVFGPGGHAYVYLCYGLHTMLNVVANKEGNGAAILICACAPISRQKTDKPVLLTGPGKHVGSAKYWGKFSYYYS